MTGKCEQCRRLNVRHLRACIISILACMLVRAPSPSTNLLVHTTPHHPTFCSLAQRGMSWKGETTVPVALSSMKTRCSVGTDRVRRWMAEREGRGQQGRPLVILQSQNAPSSSSDPLLRTQRQAISTTRDSPKVWGAPTILVVYSMKGSVEDEDAAAAVVVARCLLCSDSLRSALLMQVDR